MSLLYFVLPLFTLYYLLVSVHGAQVSQPFWTEAVPFAVRTPYLNAWHYPFSGSTNAFPVFWDGGVSGHYTSRHCVILHKGTSEYRVFMLYSG